MGYSVFVLRYRIWWDISNNGPLQDLGRAVQFITNHAQQFGVQPENYALVGLFLRRAAVRAVQFG